MLLLSSHGCPCSVSFFPLPRFSSDHGVGLCWCGAYWRPLSLSCSSRSPRCPTNHLPSPYAPPPRPLSTSSGSSIFTDVVQCSGRAGGGDGWNIRFRLLSVPSRILQDIPHDFAVSA